MRPKCPWIRSKKDIKILFTSSSSIDCFFFFFFYGFLQERFQWQIRARTATARSSSSAQQKPSGKHPVELFNQSFQTPVRASSVTSCWTHFFIFSFSFSCLSFWAGLMVNTWCSGRWRMGWMWSPRWNPLVYTMAVWSKKLSSQTAGRSNDARVHSQTSAGWVIVQQSSIYSVLARVFVHSEGGAVAGDQLLLKSVLFNFWFWGWAKPEVSNAQTDIFTL